MDVLGTCVRGALKSSSVGVMQKLDYPEKAGTQEIMNIAIRNSDSWYFLLKSASALTITQKCENRKQYCCKRIFATNLDFAMSNEIWWLQRYIKLLAETRKRKNGPIFFSVDSNSSEFRELTNPRSSHFGLRNEAVNLRPAPILPPRIAMR